MGLFGGKARARADEHPRGCQCGECRAVASSGRSAQSTLEYFVGTRLDERAVRQAVLHGYLAEFSPRLAEAVRLYPEVARALEELL